MKYKIISLVLSSILICGSSLSTVNADPVDTPAKVMAEEIAEADAVDESGESETDPGIENVQDKNAEDIASGSEDMPIENNETGDDLSTDVSEEDNAKTDKADASENEEEDNETETGIIASGTCENDEVVWELTVDGVLNISGTGDMGWGFSINATEIPWHKYKDDIRSVILDEGVTCVAPYAFSDCANLTEVSIPSGVTWIGDYAFANCSGLTEIALPDSLTSIGEHAFENCSSLSEITYSENLELEEVGQDAFGGTPWSEQAADENGLLIINKTLISCIGDKTTIVIPDTITKIAGEAFLGNKYIKEIVIPDSVTEIGSSAFQECTALEEIKLSNSISEISGVLFCGCTSLTEIVIPEGVSSIGPSAFEDCNDLTDIKLPQGLKSIGYTAFAGCEKLVDIDMPDSVADIGSFAFRDAGLKRVIIPDNVTMLGMGIFCDCRSLKEVTLSENLTGLGTWVFENCTSLTSIVIPDNVTEIEWGAFLRCTNLTEIKLSNNLTYIGAQVFEGCENLRQILLPDSLTTISASAFMNTGIKSIVIPNSVSMIDIWAVGYYSVEEGEEEEQLLVDGFTIYGYPGSEAETYAGENGLNFKLVSEAQDELQIVPELTESTYVIGSGEGLTIYCTGELGDFVSVEMDGELVDPANYTLEEGSTILTFTSAYLDTLSPGRHTVTMNYIYGSVSTSIMILERGSMVDNSDNGTGDGSGTAGVNTTNTGNTTTSVKTGDTENVNLWLMTVIGSAAVGIGIVIVQKKRKIG